MNNGKLGICVIGAGRAGMIHAVDFKTGVSGAELICVADPFEEAAKNACKELELSTYYLDYHDALNDSRVDAVVIVTPTVLHKGIAMAAANAGKHIFCEKPMAMDEDECDEMITCAKKNNVIIQLGFMRRFNESFMDAKEVIDSGEIGDVVMVRSNTRGPSVPQKWMYDIAKSNGPLAEVCSHDIDSLRWFTQSEFKSVYAIGGNYRCPDARAEFPDFYDNVIVNASFVNGMQGMIDGAQGVGYGYDSRVEILGTKGCIFLGQVHEKSIAVCSTGKGMNKPVMNSWRYLFREAYMQEDRDFVRCALSGETPKVTGIDGKMAVKVVKAGNLSIIEKRIVELKY
jgi:myo-inositol 2-dehydrogenase/D-chiro-inositol 1-dehydrogenase/scyllo-inositol 2-dehydrogenase (NAD+)